MGRNLRLCLVIGLLTAAGVGLLDPNCVAAAPEGNLQGAGFTTLEPSGSKVLAPMEVSVSFLTEPLLNEAAVLRVAVRPLVDAPNTTVQITLPEGFELVEGSLDWQGDIPQDDTVEVRATLRAIRTGEWTLFAEATSQRSDGVTFGKSETLYVTVTPTHATVSQVPSQLPETIPVSAVERIEQGSMPRGGSQDATSPKLRPRRPGADESQVDSPLGTITVYGYWSYRDKAGTDHPLRDAKVEIWDADDTSPDDLLATTYTNSSGRYESTVPNDDVWLGQDIYVKIWSTDDFSVRVENFSGGKYYAQTPTTDDVGDGTFYVGSYIITDANNRMAWFIYDKIANDAYYYLLSQVGWSNSYNLQVRWTPTSTDGTHYHLGGSIDLLAGDRWDEDVILHEYGHFTMYKIYSTYPSTPNCNPHYWGVHSSTGCAWSEGWATFLQGAIQGHDDYVDTEDQTLHFYMEPPTPTAHHDQDEGAVSACLWDIFDTHDETWDSLDNGLNGSSNNGIWRIVYNDDPNNIQDFWNDWRASANGFCSQVWSILDHHLIDYDTFAPSNPSSVWSTSHSIGVWSNDNTINLSWSGASDGCGSGVYGYSWAFSTSSSSIPDAIVDTTGTSITGMALGNNSNWYFHVRTRDYAGNWNSGAAHLGPFRIDGSSPSNPTSVSETHGAPNNVWQNSVSDPAFTWSGASDTGGSGVAGYYVYWGTSSSGTSGYWTTSASYNPGAVSSPGVRYLRVQTWDNAGNSSGWTTLFTFKYDASAPSNPTSVSETHGAPNNVWQNSVGDPAFTWSGASDGSGSGVAGYYVYWGTSSSGTSGYWTTSASYNPGAVSSPGVRYLRVQTWDNAGNSSGWTTLFTFRYDASAPSSPTSVTETHGAPNNTWQNSVGDPAFTWSGASDGSGSGVAGYYVYWGISSSGTSGTWTNIPGYNPGAVSSPSVHYLRVQTRDNASNTSGWTTLFTFRYDASAPSNPTSVSETHGAPNNTWQNSVGDPAFTWSGASDGSGSGVAGYYVYWGTSSSGTSGTWTNIAGYNPGPVSSPSVYYLRVQTEDNVGNTSGWMTLFTFRYDASAPSNPSSVSSSSHTVGAWSDDNTIDVNWSGASDGSGSGVNGYSYEWSTSSGTLPDTTVDTTGSSTTSPALGNSSSWYFHIRTRDNVGNWNTGAVHLGPFGIDISSPSNPTSVSETHGAPNDTWQNSVGDPAFTWSGASDAGGSGVAGYYVYWGISSSGTSSTWITSASYDPGPVSSPSVYYLRVQTVDNAGNTSGWTTLFTFKYDASAPSNPTSVSETHGAPNDVWQNTVGDPAFTWSGASDGSGSGVAGYYVYWGTSSSGTSGTWTTSASYAPGAVSSPSVHYLRVQTGDNVGNTSSWTTLFTLKYDASPPSNPSSITSPSHTVGVWSNDNTILMTWSGASDGGGSGVHGYSYEWSTAADTIPDDTVDTTGTSVTSPALSDGDTWYFHLVTQDNLGHWSEGAVHSGPYLVDASAPSCAVEPLPASQKAVFFEVAWSGTDAAPGSGLESYDVQYRVGAGGAWTDWMVGTTAMWATFGPWDPVHLENGQTYYFRCRARDTAANVGVYAGGDGDTWTTIYKSTVFLPLIQR